MGTFDVNVLRLPDTKKYRELAQILCSKVTTTYHLRLIMDCSIWIVKKKKKNDERKRPRFMLERKNKTKIIKEEQEKRKEAIALYIDVYCLFQCIGRKKEEKREKKSLKWNINSLIQIWTRLVDFISNDDNHNTMCSSSRILVDWLVCWLVLWHVNTCWVI